MNLMIVEDEKDFYEVLSSFLKKLDFEIFWANSSKVAYELIKKYKFKAIILDIELKENITGLDLIEEFKKYLLDLIVITGYDKYRENLIKLIKDGVIIDFFIKPFDYKLLEHRFSILKEKYALKEEEENSVIEEYGIVGNSPSIKKVLKDIKIVSKKGINVLIEGETGTGKELVARAIHKISKKEGIFVVLNCASIPESMAEAEIFGVKKGAATDVLERKGKLLLANKGTIFLDEITSMPISIQGKFLRAIEEKLFYPLGSDEIVGSDFRLISATNKDIRKLIEKKRFREDLYYRISHLKIYLPPLRERKEDIGILARHFIKNLSNFHNEEKEITNEAIEILTSFDWKGNIRELQSFLSNLFLFDSDKIINSYDVYRLLSQFTPSDTKIDKRRRFSYPMNLKNYLMEIEKEAIEKALIQTKGNIKKAAEILNVPRKSFYRKLRLYKIKLKRE